MRVGTAEARHGREAPAGEAAGGRLFEETHVCGPSQKPEMGAVGVGCRQRPSPVLAAVHQSLPPSAGKVCYVLQLIAEKDGRDGGLRLIYNLSTNRASA